MTLCAACHRSVMAPSLASPANVKGDRMKKSIVALAAAAALAAGCGGSAPSRSSRYAMSVDNPWFPLRPGTTYVYTGEKDHKPDRDVVTVTHATKLIHGVRCTAVR